VNLRGSRPGKESSRAKNEVACNAKASNATFEWSRYDQSYSVVDVLKVEEMLTIHNLEDDDG
jgi:hypothetical protein